MHYKAKFKYIYMTADGRTYMLV